MRDKIINDEFGRIAIPDTAEAKGVYAEVCEQDTYQFRKLHASGLRVDLAVDLGASWGVASRMIRHFWPAARILAFEPDPIRFAYLKENCPTVDLKNISVAGFVNDRARLLAGIGADLVRWRLDPADALRAFTPHSVPTAFAGIEKIDLMKIDVEGFELGIIQELGEMGLLKRIQHITGEWHFENARLGLIETLKSTHNTEVIMPTPTTQWHAFRATAKN